MPEYDGYRHSSCSSQQIERYLAQQLSDIEESDIELHLDTCQTCRTTMEQLAADGVFWMSATKSLSGTDFRPAGTQLEPHSAETQKSPSETLEKLIQSFLGASDDPAMLGRIANYEVCGVIGHGAMGVVLKALDRSLNRFVAIKVMSPTLSANASARKRFAREAQAAAAIVHSNVTAIHAISEWNGLPYLVMPYVAGESLQKRIDRFGPMQLSEILRVGHQVASGLAAAHAQGLIHRDIKPSNILLENGVERLQITDFGLARAADDATLTQSGVIAGTPQYMSPEQARGEPIDHRSDLFSLGSVLYTVCTGHAPFRAETSFGVLRRISDERARSIRESNAGLPLWLCDLIDRLHKKRPDDRIASATEAADLFEQCLAHVQQPDLIGLPTVAKKKSRILKPAVFIAALLIACVVLPKWIPSSNDDEVTTAAETRPEASGSGDSAPTASDESVPDPSDPDPPEAVAVQSPATQPRDSQSPAVTPAELRYTFPPDVDVAYSVRLTADLEVVERIVEGMIVYKAEAIGGDGLVIQCRSDLSQTERFRGPPTASYMMSMSRSAWASGRRQLTMRIDEHGNITQHGERLELPFGLGNLPELLLPELPVGLNDKWSRQRLVRMQTSAPAFSIPAFHGRRSSFGGRFSGMNSTQQISAIVDVESHVIESTPHRVRVQETITTGDGQPLSIDGAGSFLFDPVSGQISRYDCRQTIVESGMLNPTGMQVEVECIRLTPDEQKVWEEEKAAARAKQKYETERPFSATETTQLLDDLANEKNVAIWLARIDLKPVENLSTDVIDAVIPFVDHTNNAYQATAKRIVDRIPEDLLNPFKDVLELDRIDPPTDTD